MSIRIASAVLLLTVLPACGHKHKNRSDIIHAPEDLMVQSPLSLAGSNPSGRDEPSFNRCIAGDVDGTCNLPYVAVGEGTRDEQVASILSSTLVSHDWQIARFKAFLQGTRPEIISMLSCVKGVAISGDIRPSFYHPSSAGIYLDAGYFALTPEETGTVSKTPDSRQQNFDQISLLFFTMNTVRQQTTEENLRTGLERLLAHELAHACDFKSKALTDRYLSDALPVTPKNAAYHLAQWLFFGDLRSKKEFAKFTPAEIGKSFEDGPVVDIYGYSNQYEHLAMVVQDQLMFEFNGNNRFDLLTDNPKGQSVRALPIYWGMKGKFCQPDLFTSGRELTTKIVPMKLEFQKTQADCSTAVFPAGIPVYEALGIAP